MKNFLFLILLTSSFAVNAQVNIKGAYSSFLKDPDLKHATVSLYIVDQATGSPILESNIETGLATASTLKTITSATAYALLSPAFTWKTTLAYTGNIVNGVLNGDIVIKGSGDPTLGSWRYGNTKEELVLQEFLSAIRQQGIRSITGHVLTDESAWPGEITPDGWSWQDIGNYYGAGARALNWRENQYDIFLGSGSEVKSRVRIVRTIPPFVADLQLTSAATAAAKGSGDNAYIYHRLNDSTGFVRGTIPAGEQAFKISGSMPDAAKQLAIELEAKLKDQTPEIVAISYQNHLNNAPASSFYSYSSPSLDSISYWFLQKSINLYGESFLKTLGFEVNRSGTTRDGVKAIQNFWQKNSIEPYALNIQDGSGLSPGNRVTTSALVQVLQFTKKQPWFASYFNGFPTINGIKMKSGSINGVLAYTGFIKSRNGKEYVFAFIVNNYDGGGNAMRRKMWRLLDHLK